jgi:hypothetical protein
MCQKRLIVGGLGATLLIAVLTVGTARAVPILQVGVPDGSGGYVAYTTVGSDAETAFTSGNQLAVAGLYQHSDILLIGGKFEGNTTYAAGSDWSALGFNAAFDGKGAVLVATVGGTGSLTIDGANAFYSTGTFGDGFVVPNPPSNHYPIQSGDSYLFFDIGDFGRIGAVPDFAGGGSGSPGEVKALTLSSSGFDWVHFDVFALISVEDTTRTRVDKRWVTSYVTAVGEDGNPGSHDVTWTPPNQVPEPGTIVLLGAGVLGLGLVGRRRKDC